MALRLYDIPGKQEGQQTPITSLLPLRCDDTGTHIDTYLIVASSIYLSSWCIDFLSGLWYTGTGKSDKLCVYHPLVGSLGSKCSKRLGMISHFSLQRLAATVPGNMVGGRVSCGHAPVRFVIELPQGQFFCCDVLQKRYLHL